MNLLETWARHKALREAAVFIGFLVLTSIITWPWILQLRDGVPDYGDPYSISYFIWWDYHQTFSDPLNLFHATIFYPYRYSLAFGEYDYGVSLLFFPLFALGIRPLTIYNIAAFLSFPFTAYGTFRLARTLSGSPSVGWIAGIILAFVPFRFHHLSHLHLIFAGWIPLLFEALIVYARTRTWRSAAWLGLTFLMNGLTCTTWLFLTAIPLAASGLILVFRNRLWRDRTFWTRAFITLAIASLLLLPFLIPHVRVAEANGFARTEKEVLQYSAVPINWIAAEERNRLWRGFGKAGARNEMVLFPGLLAPLLALAALLLTTRRSANNSTGLLQVVTPCLDIIAVICGVLALLSVGYSGFRLRPFGYTVLSISGPSRCLLILAVILLIRLSLAYPAFVRNIIPTEKNLLRTIANPDRSELLVHGLLWLVIGFAGSFGLNFFFHRFLYDFVPGFEGMRVAVRWAMIAYVGLALLAGAGARVLISSFAGPRSGILRSAAFALLLLGLLFEFNVAPLELLRGHPDPDAITLFLKSQKLRGGIVELPAGDRNHMYMLRAIDHGHPLVNANDSFMSPLALEVERVTDIDPDANRFVELLEQTPVSYVTVHNSLLTPERRLFLERLLAQLVAEGHLTFIGSFPSAWTNESANRDDLYAVSKVEPQAERLPEAELPAFLHTTAFVVTDYFLYLHRDPDEGGFKFWLERLDKAVDYKGVNEAFANSPERK